MFINNIAEFEHRYLDLLKKIENFLYNAPYGHLKVQKRGDAFYYYQCEPKKTNGIYLKTNNARDEDIIYQLCLKQYYKHLLPVVKKDLNAIQNVKKKASEKTLGEVYDSLPDGIKVKIAAIEYSDEEFIKRWITAPYTACPTPFNSTAFFTKKGEQVRSKTELIIADKLYYFGIPYKYEKKIVFNECGVFYPDFTVLNVRTRQIFIWEHFGRMGHSDYRENAFKKISIFREYEKKMGYTFIPSFEEESMSLSSTEIENIIINNFT